MPTSLSPEISVLIAAYLTGEIAPEEEARLLAWRKENLENEAAYQKAVTLWQVDLPSGTEKDWNTADEWSKFLQKVQSPPAAGRVVPMNSRPPYWTWGVAASILLALAFFLWPESELPMVQFATLEDEQKELTLPDGSTVWLNKKSAITFEEGFEVRTINLIGEAFFDVKRDTTSPFTIRSGKAVTTVLGTSFNVRAYPEDEKVEVTVATGKVALSEGATSVQLVPGNTGIFEKEKGSISIKKGANTHALAWKTGVLDFRNEKLQEIIPVLERMYDIRVELKNPAIANCRFSGIFENRQPSEIIDVIKYALSLEEGPTADTPNRVVLNGPGCQ